MEEQEGSERGESDRQFGLNLSVPAKYEPQNQLAERRMPNREFVPSEEEAFSLDRYIQALQRRKWLLAAVMATVVVLAALQVMTTTPLYRATATMQIDPEQQNILPYQQITPGAPGGWLLYEYIATQSQNFHSIGLAEGVVKRLDLAARDDFSRPVKAGVVTRLKSKLLGSVKAIFRGTSRPSAVTEASAVVDPIAGSAGRVRAGLKVEPVPDTRLLEISFTSPSPQVAAEVANAAIEEFIEQHLEGNYEASIKATDFLRKQLLELQIQVEESEEALLAYAQANKVVNVGDREIINRKRLGDLNDQLTEAAAELIAKSTTYQAARRADVNAFPESLKTPNIQGLEQRLSELERKLAGFSSRYGPEWPEVKTLNIEVGELHQQLLLERRRALASARQDYELAQRRHAQLSAAVTDQRTVVDQLNVDSIQYNILKREVDSNKELYDGLLQRLKEAGVSAGLRSSNIRLADRAMVPGGASSPQKTRAMMLALVVGLFLGIAAIMMAETLDNTIKTVEDVDRLLGLPALGVVPDLSGPQISVVKRTFSSRRLERSDPLVASPDSPKGFRALEAYRSLRTSLLLSHSGKPPQAIMVTSALPSEGKSTTATNTAIALSQTGARTVLLDCDMRKPSLSKIFDVSDGRGMSTYLSGNSDLASQVQETLFPSLFVVPAGPLAPNPAELLGSQRMILGLSLMRENFAYVVLDCPPVLELSDALVLSSHVDGVILVARSGRTPWKAVARGASRLMSVGGTLLGVLLNAVDATANAYGYGYGDGYGYDGYYGRPPEPPEESRESA